MSKAESMTKLPHEPTTSDSSSDALAPAPLQGERLLEDKVPKTGTENVSEQTSDDKVMRVNWDGPGDPMNPKKFVQLLFCQIGNNLTT
jgi:hypothetical protein